MDKAESAKNLGNMHEAEAFALKVNDLLTKYNLSKFDVGEKKEKNPIDNQELKDITPAKNEGQWILDLYGVICRYNFGKMIIVNSHNRETGKPFKYATLFGTKDDLEVIRFLGEQLEHKIRFAGKSTYRNVGSTVTKKNTFLRSFYMGAVDGISFKFMQLRDQQQKDNSMVTTLVVSRNKHIDEAINEKFSNLKKGKVRKQNKNDGTLLGFMAGKNMDINKGVGNGMESAKLTG